MTHEKAMVTIKAQPWYEKANVDVKSKIENLDERLDFILIDLASDSLSEGSKIFSIEYFLIDKIGICIRTISQTPNGKKFYKNFFYGAS